MVIDIHNHIVPADFPPDPTGGGLDRWPTMAHGEGGNATVMIAGKPFRKIDLLCWDADAKCAAMDKNGVAMQVVSPMPELLSYWFEPAHTVTLGRHIAEAIAELRVAAPGRIEGLGMVPLQDPGAAAEELAILKSEFGLKGVEIGSHILGKSLGDESLDPFYQAAEELGMAVFVHAVRPLGQDRWGSHPMMAGLVGYPLEAGIAAAEIISGRVLARFPRLKIIFAHGGASFLSILPRLVKGWTENPALRDKLGENPIETARRFHYDTVTFQPELLQALIGMFSADRLMIGSDFPFLMRQDRPGDVLEPLGLDAKTKRAIAAENARNLLDLG